MDGDRGQLVVIEPAAGVQAIVKVEPKGFDEVEARSGVRRQPDDRPGVRRDLRMNERDLHGPSSQRERTTTVPATLSCQVWRSLSQIIHR